MPRGGKTRTSGQGRPKGAKNKLTVEAKEAFRLAALEDPLEETHRPRFFCQRRRATKSEAHSLRAQLVEQVGLLEGRYQFFQKKHDHAVAAPFQFRPDGELGVEAADRAHRAQQHLQRPAAVRRPRGDRDILAAALAGRGEYELFPCDPALADTAAFCDAYGFAPEDSANTIIVVGKGAEPVYRLLGREGLGVEEMPGPDRPVGKTIGYHLRRGGHALTAYDWEQYLNFADKHLRK